MSSHPPSNAVSIVAGRQADWQAGIVQPGMCHAGPSTSQDYREPPQSMKMRYIYIMIYILYRESERERSFYVAAKTSLNPSQCDAAVGKRQIRRKFIWQV
jgi:hypothetical protein